MRKLVSILVLVVVAWAGWGQTFSGRDFINANKDVRGGFLAGVLEGVMMSFKNSPHSELTSSPGILDYYLNNVVAIIGNASDPKQAAITGGVFFYFMESRMIEYINKNPLALDQSAIEAYQACLKDSIIDLHSDKAKSITQELMSNMQGE